LPSTSSLRSFSIELERYDKKEFAKLLTNHSIKEKFYNGSVEAYQLSATQLYDWLVNDKFHCRTT